MAAGLEDLNAEMRSRHWCAPRALRTACAFTSREGRPDRDDGRRAAHGGTGGADPGCSDEQKQCDRPEYHGGGGKVIALYLCGHPGGAGAVFLAGRKLYALPGCHSVLISIFFSKQVLKLPPH